MSRIGQSPIAVPTGVDVTVDQGTVTVKGPKGTLSFGVPGAITVRRDDANLLVERPNDERDNRALHGLTRTLVNNMVVGVTTGYSKKLKIEGVGFQAAAKGKGVELTVGYANRIVHNPPEGITVAADRIEKIDRYVAGSPGTMRSSLLIDLAQGKRIEVEALLGSVVRRAARAGVPVPIISTLYAVLKPYAAGVPPPA